jgi:hypothetical protein
VISGITPMLHPMQFPITSRYVGVGETDPPNGTGVVQLPTTPFSCRYRKTPPFAISEHLSDMAT